MTDERVDEALRRAAEKLAEKMCERCHQLQGEHGTAEFVYLHSCSHFEGGDLEGWAEAIRALREELHPSALEVEALDSFVRAMLGGRDEQH